MDCGLWTGDSLSGGRLAFSFLGRLSRPQRIDERCPLAQLEEMINALNECVSSLDAAHKAKFYKKPEMKVAYLQRRMSGLLDDLGIQVRGWAEYTQRKLDEVHDKLLNGAMRK